MRELLAFCILASACCVASRHPPPLAATGGASAPAAPGAGQADYVALDAYGPRVAPGMHLIARRESAGERVELVRAEEHDACARVAFEASAPIVARLVDAKGTTLASTTKAAASGILGEKGPVCIRKGDTLSGAIDPAVPAVQVRWVAWGT